MDRGAHVVLEAGQRQFGRARPTADGVPCLEYEDGATCLCKRDCGREPVRASADDDGV
jgi:hypothetical protein